MQQVCNQRDPNLNFNGIALSPYKYFNGKFCLICLTEIPISNIISNSCLLHIENVAAPMWCSNILFDLQPCCIFVMSINLIVPRG